MQKTGAVETSEKPAGNTPGNQRAPATEEKQRTGSAGELVIHLAAHFRRWEKDIPQDKEPIVVAVLANGTAIPVTRLGSEGYHGLIIFGKLDGSHCMITSHQANLTLLCTTGVKDPENYIPKIEFYVDGKELLSEGA